MSTDSEDRILQTLSYEIEKEIDELKEAMTSKLLKHAQIINVLSTRVTEQISDPENNIKKSIL